MGFIIYKKLFEVRLLHDYFLATKEDSFFSSALTNADRAAILDGKFNFDLGNELFISPTPECFEMMKNCRLRFIKTRLGFFVAQQVERIGQPDGSVRFKPVLPIEDDVRGLTFQMKTTNYLFHNYSGIPMKKNTPAVFLFNNKNGNNDKVFPALSVPVPAFLPDSTYEMGMLANNGGQLQEATITTTVNDPANWLDVDGEGFVNDQDRALLPRKFALQLPAGFSGNTIEAKLFDNAGTLVKTLSVDTNGAPAAFLDFCDDPATCTDNGQYTLTVTDNSGAIIFNKNILLDDRLFNPYCFGFIEIFPSVGTDFQLMDADGFITHSVNPDESAVSHPIYEIRIRARKTCWRYISEDEFTAMQLADTSPFLDPEPGNKVLITKQPEALLAGINKPLAAGADTIELPNPLPGNLTYGSDGKIYSDIYISRINRFQE